MTFTRCVPTAVALSTELAFGFDQRSVTMTGRFRFGAAGKQAAMKTWLVMPGRRKRGLVDFLEWHQGLSYPKTPRNTQKHRFSTDSAVRFLGCSEVGRRGRQPQKVPDLPETPTLTIFARCCCFCWFFAVIYHFTAKLLDRHLLEVSSKSICGSFATKLARSDA